MKSSGTRFQDNFKDSCTKCGFLPIRLKDAAKFGGQCGRFTSYNICDFVVACPKCFLLIENKSFKGTSFPFSNILGSDEKSKQRNMKKLKELVELDKKYSFAKSFYLILDVNYDKVYSIRASNMLEIIENSIKKSFSKSELETISEVIINGEKKRTNSFYNVSVLSNM